MRFKLIQPKYVILAVLLIAIVILQISNNILSLLFVYFLNILSTFIYLIITVIAQPNLYPIFYWITYLTVIIAVFSVIWTILWYNQIRKEFSSPIEKSKISSVRFLILIIITIVLIQILLTYYSIDYLYITSFILFNIMLLLLALRIIINISTSLAFNFNKKTNDKKPLVSIIIPAYNEGKVIENTIEALLNLKYHPLEIIFIDDGSTDNTLEIAQSYQEENLIKIISKENGGKWSALNEGINVANGDIIVNIDADTVIEENSISYLVNHFANDNSIVAIAGNIKVGNRHSILTKLQALEYIYGLNIQRRSEAYFEKLSVVPGPLGAFRKEVLDEIGNYTGDTFAEDADLTMKILKKGYKLDYEPRAIGFTEAPSTYFDLGKQRYRWYRGLLQVMKKHKDMLFNKEYGMTGIFLMPWVFFNSLFFSWFTFFTILWLFVLMFNPISEFVIYSPNPSSPNIDNLVIGEFQNNSDLILTIDFFQALPIIYIFWFFVFLVIEMMITVYALKIDVKEKLSLLWLIFIYKLFYGYVVDTLRILSHLEEIFGYPMEWEIAERSGVSS